MNEKQRLYGDTAGLTTFWLMAGFGSAMLAGHFMLRAMQRMQEAGGPSQMIAKGPFGGLGWMFDVTTPAETQAPAAAPKKAKAKAKPAAEDAEVVAPKLRLVEAGETAAEAVEALTETMSDAVEAGLAASERIATSALEATIAPTEAVKGVASEMTQAPAAAAPAEATPEAPAEETSEAPAEDAPEAAALAEMLEPVPAYPGRPTALAAPVGDADDLKKIKGVGPKLEGVLNGLGYFHFAQIAAWGPEELAAVDESLDGFAGRATRDDWIAQAKLLGEGGSTEFSKRVEDGEIY